MLPAAWSRSGGEPGHRSPDATPMADTGFEGREQGTGNGEQGLGNSVRGLMAFSMKCTAWAARLKSCPCYKARCAAFSPGCALTPGPAAFFSKM
jgi:hypothetical protein